MRHLLTIVLALIVAMDAPAHEGSHPDASAPPAGRVLGTLEFPTATESPAARDAFIRGMLLLHLFEYSFAEAEFQKAQTLDPSFAMSYWGEAMVHNHPIWDQQDGERARAVLDRFAPTPAARADKLATGKERDFFASLEILYGPRDNAQPKAMRDRAYEQHYAAMAARYPEDDEVQLFYALALMGSHAGVRDIPAYMESAALSQRVFYKNRQHPGAAHYFIHGVDDPVHAPLGLEAARALYQVAPDAGHSLHMTSHIFNALGMWEDVVVANTHAARVANEMRIERGQPPVNIGHYNFWLLYGLLQQGRDEAARALLTVAYEETLAIGKPPAARMILDPDNDPMGSMVQMWARYMLETRGSDAVVAGWTFNTADAFDPNLNIHYVKGLLEPGPDGIQKHLQAFQALQTELDRDVRALPEPRHSEYLARLKVMEQQLLAVLARAQGQHAASLQHARKASRLEGAMPYAFGPPFVDYPAAQLLGELALEQGRNAEAAEAFREQLQRSRNKRQAVAGLILATQADP